MMKEDDEYQSPGCHTILRNYTYRDIKVRTKKFFCIFEHTQLQVFLFVIAWEGKITCHSYEYTQYSVMQANAC